MGSHMDYNVLSFLIFIGHWESHQNSTRFRVMVKFVQIQLPLISPIQWRQYVLKTGELRARPLNKFLNDLFNEKFLNDFLVSYTQISIYSSKFL